MSPERQLLLDVYRGMTLRELVHLLIFGSYEPSTLQQVVFEKITQTEKQLGKSGI